MVTKLQSHEFVCNIFIIQWYDASIFCIHLWNYSIDSTLSLASYGLGRYINHSRSCSNLKGYIVEDTNKKIHLCFLAKRDIQPGEELLIDYGEKRREVLKENQWLKD